MRTPSPDISISSRALLTSGDQSQAGRRDSSHERVVFAMTAETMEMFRPTFQAHSLPPADYQWIEVAARNATAWEKLFYELEPTVLVTGWGSPMIPSGSMHAAELPLRYVCHLTGSVRQLVPRSLIERGVLVSNWGTLTSQCVAEHALLLVMGAMRDLVNWAPYMVRWEEPEFATLHLPLATRSLRGKRVGLHGFGSIARELIKLLRPFDVNLSAYSVGVPEELFVQHGVQRCRSLQELFSTSDVLIECEALTSYNRATVNLEVLRCLPDGAVFVNVGRGPVVDEEALAQVAVEKHLRLGLDVYNEEPLPSHSPLHSLPRTLLSPHVAGPSRDGFVDLCRFALANLRRYLLGEAIQARVSLEVYDRST